MLKIWKKTNLRIRILDKIKYESLKRDERFDDESYEQLISHYIALKQIMRNIKKLSRLESNSNLKQKDDDNITHDDANSNLDVS